MIRIAELQRALRHAVEAEEQHLRRKVERFQQTLKKWLAAQPPPADLPGLQALLDQFREIYNTQRIHSAKKTTPYAAYIAAPKDTPGPLAPATTRFRTDKIDATGKVTLRYDGQLFHIGIGRAHTGRARDTARPGPRHHDHPESPRHVRRLQLLGRLESWQVLVRRGIPRSSRSARCGW